MKKIIKMMAFSMLVFAGWSNLAKAQQAEKNIEEVALRSGDVFGELRKLVRDNFDFTAADYKEGTVKSDLRFSLAENGKITNIQATGDCTEVSKELENVLANLIYRVDVNHLNQKMLATTYVMPVSVTISER
ncbi:hypothetical protein [Chryseobacterium sp. SC28]|uniref:hypothetical protein n=1 Tax=Chryseobacterium sp. SC28 TaxID=2268028 RepID=UPI000F64C899|nr:hypothetical protein [Chryseobacterium sp. SC28]RRQ45690.1 hypothetical protein DTW91_08680 [Chryseobacterium sp. SC28]